MVVFDTDFAADITIMEEATEFLDRLKKGENLPLFTSCCQAWVRYVETQHPDMINHLSSCKSPQSMLSSVVKEFLPKLNPEVKAEDLVVVSIMPCTAKKAEIKRDQLKKDGKFDTDYVLTTQEFAQMIKSAGLDLKNLEPEQELEYKVNFKYQDIKKLKISVADEAEVKNATEQEFVIDEEMKQNAIIGTLIFLLIK